MVSQRAVKVGWNVQWVVFVIVMEALSRMFSASVGGGFFLGFSEGDINHGIINISHVFFAHDTLLFCEVDQGHIQSLRAILLCFEVVSGLKVNLSKSKVVAVCYVRNIRGLSHLLG